MSPFPLSANPQLPSLPVDPQLPSLPGPVRRGIRRWLLATADWVSPDR